VFEHLIFTLYILTFLFSTIGYGFVLSKIVDKNLLRFNLGWQGLLGFFFLSIISIFTSFFFSHGFYHNSIIHLVGLMSFIFFIHKLKKNSELKYLFLLICILWIGVYVYKNHDDFPYYHLTYALNLSENKFIVGTGNFSHGFRTFSSLFYYHSLLYMPLIKFYLFYIGPFFIMLFFNYIVISKLIKNFSIKNFNFVYFFLIISLVFVNVVFYRLGEHGTDRSAQILLLLIFLLFFEIIYFEKKIKNIILKTSLLVILVFLASSMKAIYYLYLILIPIIFFKKNLFLDYIKLKNFFLFFLIFLSFSLNIITYHLNTGCFLYPAEKTCFIKTEWSIPKKEVKLMSTHYEWWAKAGGGPGYTHEIEKEEYIKDFVWLENWIDRHFFNKVSDSLLAILLICLIIYFSFYFFGKKNVRKNLNHNRIGILPYLLISIFLLEWFLNHPSMRYGGYVLFALPFIVLTSSLIEKYQLFKNRVYWLTILFIVLTFVIYNVRNITRLEKEIRVYNYNLLKSPYFFVDQIISKKIISNERLTIYSPGGKMCWASKTPCSNRESLKLNKFLWMNMVSRND